MRTRLMATMMLTVAAASSESLGWAEKLPRILRAELEAERAKPSRGGAADAFTIDEDARVLLQHVRDGRMLTRISRDLGRDKRAAGNRWNMHLKALPSIGLLRALRSTAQASTVNACNVDLDAAARGDGACADADGDQPGSIDAAKMLLCREKLEAMQLQHVPQHVQQRRVSMHAAARQEAEQKKPWQITQDGQLLEDHLGGEATVDIVIEGRSDGAIRRRLHTLGRRLSFSRSAFHDTPVSGSSAYILSGALTTSDASSSNRGCVFENRFQGASV